MDLPIDICKVPRMPVPLSKQQKVKEFWKKKKEEIENIQNFSERALPVSRIKKVICAEKGAMMMAYDTPSFVTKACETFVQELAFRAWMCAKSHQRHVILDSDIAEAISSTESYDFLNDVLHAYREVHNSIPHTKPTKKRHRLNQPSTSHPPSCEVSKFNPQFNGYPVYNRTPISMPPTNFHPNPLAFPFLLQDGCSLMETTVITTPNLTETILPKSYMRRDSRFFGINLNNITNNNFTSNFLMCNDIIASNALTRPLEVYQGPMPDIPNNSFKMNMTKASIATYGAVNSSVDNVSTRNGGMAIESNHILSGVVDTGSLMPACGTTTSNDAINFDTTICVEEGLHQQQEEEITSEHHIVGNLEGILATCTSDSGSIQHENFDEFEMADVSWLSEFWDDFMIEDPAPLHVPASSNISHNLEGMDHESYLFDDIVASVSTRNKQS